MFVAICASAGCHRSQPAVESAGPDSTAIRVQTRLAADAFVWRWRFYWESSEGVSKRLSPTPIPDSMRKKGVSPVEFTAAESLALQTRYARNVIPDLLRDQLLHCHPDGTGGAQTLLPPPTTPARGGTYAPVANPANSYLRVDAYLIEAGVGHHAVCPSWPLGFPKPPWDERMGIDAAIVPPLRDSVRQARARLRSILDSAARLLPGDAWLVGQRVRFSLDQADTAAALVAVRQCRAARWWCLLLDGYLAAARRDPTPAVDSLFAAALGAMSPDDRCVWSDLTFLLDEDGRRAYARIPCAERDSVNTRIWWLSDPLFTEPGNDRRVEHYSRQVLIALRSGTDWNERWDMHDDGGGHAVREMITRYGWPSFSWWGGAANDAGHHSYLGNSNDERDHGRFATAEYSAPRFHTVPAWSAVVDPWSSLGYEWVVSQHADEYANPSDTLWWPVEHYDRVAGPMVQLWHQAGLFRRDTAVLFAMGADLVPSRFDDMVGDTLKGALVFSTGPDSMRVEPRGGITGYGAVFRAMVPVRPQLVSLELFGHHPRGVVARDRFGIEPPPALATMAAGDVAISMPVLIRPLDADEVLPNDPDVVLSRMFGSAVLHDPKRIGLYWETYGIKNGDTVDVGIRLERREDAPGTIRRIGFMLGIGQRTDGGISVGWREPDPGRIVATIPGRIPVQGRSVSLDVSGVAAGDYSLIVTINRPGSVPVTGAREFWISR